jgi:hypothetical protein
MACSGFVKQFMGLKIVHAIPFVAITSIFMRVKGIFHHYLLRSCQAVAAQSGTCPLPMALSLSTLAATPSATLPTLGSVTQLFWIDQPLSQGLDFDDLMSPPFSHLSNPLFLGWAIALAC